MTSLRFLETTATRYTQGNEVAPSSGQKIGDRFGGRRLAQLVTLLGQAGRFSSQTSRPSTDSPRAEGSEGRLPLTPRDWVTTSPWIDDPSTDIHQFLVARKIPFTAEDVENLTNWRRDGYLVLRGAADQTLIDQYLSDIAWALAHRAEMECAAEVKGEQIKISQLTDDDLASDGTKLNCLHSFSKAAILLSLSPKIQRFLYLIFQEEAAPLQSLTFWRGSSQRPHIDYPYVRTQTRIGQLAASWIALEDVEADAGPLVYYPGSHKTDLSGFFDWGDGSILLEPSSQRDPSQFSDYLEDRMRIANISPEMFMPKKGDVIIWHGNLVHGGAPVMSATATRKSYVTHYTARSAYPEDFKPKTPIEGVNVFNARPGVCWEYPWDSGKPKLPSWSE